MFKWLNNITGFIIILMPGVSGLSAVSAEQ